MTKLLKFMIVVGLMLGSSALAKAPKKNCPSTSEVKKILEMTSKLDEDGAKLHFLRKTRPSKSGTMKVKDDGKVKYFHIFRVYVKDRDVDIEENRAAVFDNDKNYLGYFPLGGADIYDVEDGQFLIEDPDNSSGDDDDEDGDGGGGDSTDYEEVQFTWDGPPKSAIVGGVAVSFIKAPQPKLTEEEKKAKEIKKKEEDTGPKFRSWTITHKGKPLTVRAKLVTVRGDKVELKSEALGTVTTIKMYTLSKQDQEYIKEYQKKNR